MSRKPIEYPIGDRFPGTKYVAIGILGAGGMGTVYDVVKEPGIRGALKIISPKLARRSEFVTRFFDEVRLVARLRHPNIVQVFDCDALADGTPFYVMERLEGKTLHQAFTDRRRAIPPTLAYEIIRQLCEALECVHSHSPPVVHRDVKPQNIFLHRPAYGDPAVKILDFGVATILDQNHDGAFFGTLRYASPEQFRGERLTIRADIYATALVLYEMLAGRGPFDDEPDMAIAQMRVEAPRLRRFAPWVPESVDELVAQALAKDPDKRPRSAYAFISKLFELQFIARDGQRPAMEVNTTAPTLTAIIDEDSSNGPPSGRGDNDTFRGMTPPPVDGGTLESAPPDFSAHTLERMAEPRQIVRVSPSGADVHAPTSTDPKSSRASKTAPLHAAHDEIFRSAETRTLERLEGGAATRDHQSPPGAEAMPDDGMAHPLIAAQMVAMSPLTSEAGTARSVDDDAHLARRKRAPLALVLAVPAAAAVIALAAWFAFAPNVPSAPAAASISSAATATSSASTLAPTPTPITIASTAPSSSAPISSAAPLATNSATSPANPMQPPSAQQAPFKTTFGAPPPTSRPSQPVAAPTAPKLPDDGRDLLFEPGRKP